MVEINDLPDGILGHILSFLTIEEAASTSLLSKRWRTMFVFSPVLDLSRIKRSTYLYSLKVQKFKKFVNQVLAVSGNSTIRRFALYCCVESAHTHSWICNVVKRGVLDLHIQAGYPIPFEVFTCKTLVKLHLTCEQITMLDNAKLQRRTSSVIPMLEDASLPALKSLCLSHVEFDDVGAFKKLISACPSLEELIIRQVKCNCWDFPRILSSLTLKRLTLVCYSRNLENMDFDHPSLIFLEYTGPVHRMNPVVNLDSLVEAKLNFLRTKHDSGDLSNLIKGLTNVKILHLLTTATLEIFGTFLKEMHVFKNLIHLTVGRRVCLPDSYLQSLLEKSPKLQTLVIEGFLVHYYIRSDCKCFLECSLLSSCPVKVLEIKYYGGHTKALEQINHFLEKFSCLELVKVCAFAKDDKQKLRLTTDLQMLPRASSKCKIQVSFLENQ